MKIFYTTTRHSKYTGQCYLRASSEGLLDRTAFLQSGSASWVITNPCRCSTIVSYSTLSSAYSSGIAKWSWTTREHSNSEVQIPMLTWGLNRWHHQFMCNMTSCVQMEITHLWTNLKNELFLGWPLTCEHDITSRHSRLCKSLTSPP